MREGKVHVLNMSEGNPVKLLLTFSVPLFLGNLLQQFYNLADTSIAVVIGLIYILVNYRWLSFGRVELSAGFSFVRKMITQGLSMALMSAIYKASARKLSPFKVMDELS